MAASVSVGVMRPLLSKLSKLVEGEWKNLKGVRKAVASLKDELTTMNAFLEKVEAAADEEELDPLAKDWRNRVREMALDMEDCIDDFTCRVAADYDDGRCGKDDGGVLRKAALRLRKLRARHRVASVIQELKTGVREASERRARYKLDVIPSSSSNATSSSSALDPRLLALYTEPSSLVGIDGPKEELLGWIMDDDEEEEKRRLKVVPVFGFGGLGKTTLANQVYHHQIIDREFDCKAFVSVSHRLDVVGLLHGISSQLRIRSSKESSSCDRDVQDLIDNIREYLQHKRYFIVIDDLWDSSHWDVIRCVFPENNLRRRVIVTTRSRSVAISCCYPDECIFHMKPLRQDDSRRLFLTRIFGSEDGCPSDFKEVSEEILKRCGGFATCSNYNCKSFSSPENEVGRRVEVHT